MAVTFYCDEEGRTPSGVDVLAALIVMQGMGAAAFGLNCAKPEIIAEQLERLAPYALIPLVAQPEGARGMVDPAAWVERYAELGVRLFGGCCGTGAADIAALREKLSALKPGPFVPREQDEDVICTEEGELLVVDFGEAHLADPYFDLAAALGGLRNHCPGERREGAAAAFLSECEGLMPGLDRGRLLGQLRLWLWRGLAQCACWAGGPGPDWTAMAGTLYRSLSWTIPD